jgi:type VI secretion system protein ImpG
MDPRLLHHYNRELQHIRELGGEFAAEFPKIASRLGIEGLECADPYVERLLEGFAFMAGRVQVKLDAEFPRFTQHLLEAVYPHYLAPTPSMTVVQIQPDLEEAGLAEGFRLDRDTALRGLLGTEHKTACEYRTAHDLTLWPLEIESADYHGSAAAVAQLGLGRIAEVKAAIRLRLRATAALTIDKLALDHLPIFIRGSEDVPNRIYEQMLGNALGIVARPGGQSTPWTERLGKSALRRVGFSDEESLLPYSPQSFNGYRLLQEYFAFPERFLFFGLEGVNRVVRRCQAPVLELIVLLGRSDPVLEEVLDAGNFALHCTPAVNLFPKRADRMHIDHRQHEYHLVPDRTRPMDFEVHSVAEVIGYGAGSQDGQPFRPLYAADDLITPRHEQAYFALRRERRRLSARQRKRGPRSSYIGNEVFIALVDGLEAPYRSDLRQLGVRALCTNRDLPLMLPVGKGNTDFILDAGGPVRAVRCLAGPTKPRTAWQEGESVWRVISHLSLNYLSLADGADGHGATALRDLLSLYAHLSEPATARQIEDLRSVASRTITRRLPVPGPITFGRGLEITVTFDEAAFQGTGVFLLGAVLEEFFARYVSINSFTETVVCTIERGEVMRWPARLGKRQLL